ncbi:WXG100-like domain-containing protein [Crossiella sp. CA198]|uniref:WXG100-like domain-containing protein n=1 Tax=Crossiella sp. CA198 TaxID=3455607 RepID=UPI003F8D4C23
MAIQEPDSGLWNEVRPRTEWPATDETMMQELARTWARTGATFERVGGEQPDARLVSGWTDGNGGTFRDKVATLRGLVFANGVRMKEISWLTEQYGNDVAHAKTEIRAFIANREPFYQQVNGLFGFFADAQAKETLLREVANTINIFLAEMAGRIGARAQGAADLLLPDLVDSALDPPEGGGVIPPPLNPRGRGRRGDRPKNTAPRPDVPVLDGGSLTGIGRRIWGNGPDVADALLGTRTKDELRALASRSDAAKLRDFYQAAVDTDRGGTTAPTRVRLAQEIIDAWDG